MQPNDPEVYNVVAECFAEALGLEPEEIEYDALVIDDLGAESLDLLDIVFRLERAFKIKIPRGGIESAAKEGLSDDEEYEVGGVLTALGLERLAAAMPEIPSDSFQEGLKVSEIPLLFRGSTFCRLVVELVESQNA